MSKTIDLTKGKVAIVDDDDYVELSKWKWSLSSHGYAVRSQHRYLGFKKYTNAVFYMHREILKTDLEVDHINSDKLDNRKENLRSANRQQQVQNTSSRKGSSSKYVGVHLHNLTGKWRAQIKVDGKVKSLGLFHCQEDAREARDNFIESNGLDRFRR